MAPGNLVEMDAVKADRGNYLGYVRAIGRRRPDVKLDDPMTSMGTSELRLAATPSMQSVSRPAVP